MKKSSRVPLSVTLGLFGITLLQAPFLTPAGHAQSAAQTALGGAVTQAAVQASVPRFFVSPSGNNTTGDSFATAFRDFASIPWTKIPPGAIIEVDGGQPDPNNAPFQGGRNYTTPLVIPAVGTLANPVRIVASNAPGRNGPIRILNASEYGIDIRQGASVVINGLRSTLSQPHWNVFGCRRGGVIVRPGALRATLIGVEVDSNGRDSSGRGISVQGGNEVRILNCDVHDNQHRNIEVRQDFLPGTHRTIIDRTWVHANFYNSEINKIGGTRNGGIDTFTDAQNLVSINSCVIGPALDDALNLNPGRNRNATSTTVACQDTLFVNNDVANLNVRTRFARIDNVTSYLSPVNSQGRAHRALFITNPREFNVTDSIFYEGVVVKDSDVIPTVEETGVNFRRGNNVQVRTTFNTTLLSSTMTDPQAVFQSPIFTLPQIRRALPPVAYKPFVFTTQAIPGRPGVGTTSIFSIGQILNLGVKPELFQ